MGHHSPVLNLLWWMLEWLPSPSVSHDPLVTLLRWIWEYAIFTGLVVVFGSLRSALFFDGSVRRPSTWSTLHTHYILNYPIFALPLSAP